MEYQRSNLFQAVPVSHAESEYKQVEMEFFGGLSDTFQKISDKASRQVGLEVGSEAIETKEVVDENGETHYVPTYSEHPLAGFTSFGDAYNEAAADAYRASVETDFYETAEQLQGAHPADIEGFDKSAQAFEKAYFKGMSGAQRAEALPLWTKLKGRARSTVQVAQQKKFLAANVAKLNDEISTLKTRSLKAYRSGDQGQGDEFRNQYLFRQQRAGQVYGKSLDTIRKETEAYAKEVESQLALGKFERDRELVGIAKALDNLKDGKYETLDPGDIEKLKDEAWNLFEDENRLRDKMEAEADEREQDIQDRLEAMMESEMLKGTLSNKGLQKYLDMGADPTVVGKYRKQLTSGTAVKSDPITLMNVKTELHKYDEKTIRSMEGLSPADKTALIAELREIRQPGHWRSKPAWKEAVRRINGDKFGLGSDKDDQERIKLANKVQTKLWEQIEAILATKPNAMLENPNLPKELVSGLIDEEVIDNRKQRAAALRERIKKYESDHPWLKSGEQPANKMDDALYRGAYEEAVKELQQLEAGL